MNQVTKVKILRDFKRKGSELYRSADGEWEWYLEWNWISERAALEERAAMTGSRLTMKKLEAFVSQ